MDESDRRDVEAVLAGETDRFESIVARWEKPLVNLAWRFVRDRAIAEEMAQEAFLRCYRKLRLWKSNTEFSTWLFALAINVYRSTLRKKRLPIDDEVRLETLGRNGSIEADLLSEEKNEIVRRIVSHLPETYRDAIVIYYFEENDLTTTARRLGLPEGTVKARLHRGRKILEERLGRILK